MSGAPERSIAAPTSAFEQCLAQAFGARRALAFARGSTALYALFCAIAEKHGPGEVIIPAICCEVVALAARYAGMRPVFADIDPETMCLSPRDAAQHLSERTRAIVVAHMFGNFADPAPFLALRARRDIVLIEDVALAAGGVAPDGRHFGTLLDCALLSFANDKIIRGAGGALLLNASFPALALDEARDALPQPLPQARLAELALSLRNLGHALAERWRETGESPGGAFVAAADQYLELIVRRAGALPEAELLAAVAGLNADAAGRRDKQARYRAAIRAPGVRQPGFAAGATCWRAPLLFDEPERALRATRALRAAGFHASNHYFPLDILFGCAPAPASASAARRIVQLWADPFTGESAVEGAARVVNQVCAA